MPTTDVSLYGDKSLPEWDSEWDLIPEGLRAFQDNLKYLVGLYRISLNKQRILIGVGTAKQGALAKRLSDYRRPSPSGRRCRSGEYIYENRHRLKVEVLVLGEAGDREAVRLAKQLKWGMIELHKPTEQRDLSVVAKLKPVGRL